MDQSEATVKTEGEFIKDCCIGQVSTLSSSQERTCQEVHKVNFSLSPFLSRSSDLF